MTRIVSELPVVPVTSRGRHLVVVDSETTGPDPTRHVPVEVGWWNLGTGERGLFIPVHTRADLRRADPKALEINRYYERGLDLVSQWDTNGTCLEILHEVLVGNSLVGSNPVFDASMLNPLFLRHGLAPAPWHYALLDVGTYAAGVLGLSIGERLTLSELCQLFGMPAQTHDAEGDVTATGRCLLELQRCITNRDELLCELTQIRTNRTPLEGK